MKCPICGKEVAFSDPEMPFCSERCRLIDLGNWASEKYVISSPLESHDDLAPRDFGNDPEPDLEAGLKRDTQNKKGRVQ